MARILSIDDDVEILKLIKRALERDNHEVVSAYNSHEVDMGKINSFDLILLDIMMPGVDGIKLCEQIRSKVDCPIIFITAKTMDDDLFEGFRVGADDYIKKPFSIIELRARVNAHLRREKREHHNRMICGELSLDLPAKELLYQDTLINLTKSEYEICEFLIRNKGQVFSLEQIIENALGYDSQSDTSAIREHIKNIRNKLEKYGQKPIQTVWGIGYKWM